MSVQERWQQGRWRQGLSGARRPTGQDAESRRGWSGRWRVVVLAAVVMLAGSGWLVASQFRRPAETMYTPAADAYVSTAHPATNYGTMPTLRADATPKIRSYLRFRLNGLSGRRVVKAELRLWSRTGDLVGYSVHPTISSNWDELAITLDNGPATGASQATSGPFGPSTWSSTDVTRLVQDSRDVSLTLTTRSRQNVVFDSRDGAHQPQLVVQTKAGRPFPAAAASAFPNR
jgi:hypothetical protein